MILSDPGGAVKRSSFLGDAESGGVGLGNGGDKF
jgi:hypothetical protein